MSTVRGAPPGTLMVTCWCEKAFVYVKREHVGTLTHNCGRPGCILIEQGNVEMRMSAQSSVLRSMPLRLDGAARPSSAA